MWQPIALNTSGKTEVKTGGVTIELSRRDDALWNIAVVDAELSWSVFSESRFVLIKPFFPDTAFLFFTDDQYVLAPGREAVFSVALPASLQVIIGDTTIAVPDAPLKKSFEGTDTINGELCSIAPHNAKLLWTGPAEGKKGSSAAPPASEDNGGRFCITTEALIRNRSKQDYVFDRVLIYTETIDIFENNGRLACDIAAIEYLGGGEFRMQTPPPEKITANPDKFRVVSRGAKDDVGARLFRQGAGFIKQLTDIKVS